MSQPIPELATVTLLLTVELSPEAAQAAPPRPLDRAWATQLAEAVAADLTPRVTDIHRFGLVLAAGLYDQTEILRPGFPVSQALEGVFRGTLKDGFNPQLIALGLDRAEDRFPIAALEPACRPGSGPLLLLPLALVGPRAALKPVAERLEAELLEQGVTGETTRALLAEGFGLQPVHTSYATLGDLCALLQVQLENAGFGPLWQILEHAFLERDGAAWVELPGGNLFAALGGDVYTPFYTFDAWASRGPGQDRQTDLLAHYRDWTLEQRRYQAALAAHDYRVLPIRGEGRYRGGRGGLERLVHGEPVDGDWLDEPVPGLAADGQPSRLGVTHQTDPQLGILAYTVATQDATGRTLALEHYYPLTAQAVPGILKSQARRAQEQGLTLAEARPRTPVLRADGRGLAPAPAPDPATNPRPH